MSDKELLELDSLLAEIERRKRYNKIDTAFPATGEFSRDKYTKQMAFFAAGKDFRERALVAANRSGKTFAAMYEATLHLTGLYPDWWTGHRYKHPISAWFIGKSNESTKGILQEELIGSVMDKGSGLIPKDMIISTTNRPGVPEAILVVRVRHFTNGIEDGFSEGVFKSYEQGREALQGTAINLVCLDEEPKDPEIYQECLMRTMKCRVCQKCAGRVMCTFTPLFGLSKIVLEFLPGGRFPMGDVNPLNNKWVTQITWDDVPHLSEQEKAEMLQAIPPWMRDARTRGIPQIGAGAIFAVSENDITVQPFTIPNHWPKVYGFDVGWHKSAAVWMAQDPSSNVWYIYSEHYAGRDEPPIHAQAIKSRGAWIPGVIDPASNRSRDDGTRLLHQYMDLGLDLTMASNAIETGLSAVWTMLTCGQLKVFATCQNWFNEFRTYHKDDKGKIPDGQDDHLMDAMRYCVISGLDRARVNPMYDEEDGYGYTPDPQALGASRTTGY